jgi:hypothetical protein
VAAELLANAQHTEVVSSAATAQSQIEISAASFEDDLSIGIIDLSILAFSSSFDSADSHESLVQLANFANSNYVEHSDFCLSYLRSCNIAAARKTPASFVCRPSNTQTSSRPQNTQTSSRPQNRKTNSRPQNTQRINRTRS